MSDIPMTDEECRLASEALSDQLDRYASLLVRKAVPSARDRSSFSRLPWSAQTSPAGSSR